MSDSPNPFEPPREQQPASTYPEVDFREVIRRGFAAAHRCLTGGIWMFVVLLPLQIQNSVMSSVMFESGLFDQLQSGDANPGSGPPPGVFMMMGFGCFSCVWGLILLFAIPWIWGGIAGQLRDRLIAAQVDRFGSYGGRYYSSMLLFLIVFGAVVIALSIPNAVVGQWVSASAFGPGQPMDAESLRRLSLHPANLISGILTALVLVGAGTLLNVLIAMTVAIGRGFREGLGAGLSFCGGNITDLFKLYSVSVLLMVPVFIVSWLPQLLLPGVWSGILVGVLSALFLGYLSVVNLGLAASLVAAKMTPTGSTPHGMGHAPTIAS